MRDVGYVEGRELDLQDAGRFGDVDADVEAAVVGADVDSAFEGEAAGWGGGGLGGE